MESMYYHRFLLSRRFTQGTLMFLFFAGNAYGWTVLRGNISSSMVLGVLPLTDPFAALQIFFAGVLVSVEALTGALVVALFFALLGGRSFCSWVCPLNVVTDLADWLRERPWIRGIPGALQINRSVRYWAIGISLVLSAWLGIAAFEWISPVSMLHRGIIFGIGAGWTVILAIFLFDLFLVRNGFCGHVCPLGGFYSLLGRYSLIRVRHEQQRCTLCMKCLDHCPEKQVLSMVGVQSAVVSSGECTNCGKCVEVCRDRAMGFGARLFIRKPNH